MKPKKWVPWLALGLTAGMLVFIYARSLRPAEQSELESTVIWRLLLAVFPNLTQHFVRKLAHFTEYFALGLLLRWTLRAWRVRWPQAVCAAFLGLLAALGDETIQLYVPGRSGSPLDVWLDFSGVLLGCLLLTFLFFCKKSPRR